MVAENETVLGRLNLRVYQQSVHPDTPVLTSWKPCQMPRRHCRQWFDQSFHIVQHRVPIKSDNVHPMPASANTEIQPMRRRQPHLPRLQTAGAPTRVLLNDLPQPMVYVLPGQYRLPPSSQPIPHQSVPAPPSPQ